MQGMTLFDLACVLLVIISVCAAIRSITSLRRPQIIRVAVMIFSFSAVAAPLMQARPALATPLTNPDIGPALTCSTYRQIPRNEFEYQMQEGAQDRAIGDWVHTYSSIIHYDNAYNMANEDDSLRELAAMNMACEFIYKANLEEQLIQSRKNPAFVTSPKISSPPEDITALSDTEIAMFRNADCDIAAQLVSFTLHPEVGAWAATHGCSWSALPKEVLLKTPPQASDGHAAALPLPASLTIRDKLGEMNGIEEIVWLMVGNQKRIIYLRDGYRQVQQVTFGLPALRIYRYAFKEKTFFVAPATVPDRFAAGVLLADGKTHNLEVSESRDLDVVLRPYPQ